MSLGSGQTLYVSVYEGGVDRYGLSRISRNPQTTRDRAYERIASAQQAAHIALVARAVIDESGKAAEASA